MRKFTKTLLGFCLLASSAYAAEFTKPNKIDIKNGEKIYNSQCVSCHGPKGMADYKNPMFPPLNGQYATYMVIQLKAFIDDRPKYKRDSLNSAMMEPFAKALTTQEMWDVSTYLENVKERRTFPKEWYDENKEEIQWAKKFRKSACASCHGPKREGRYPSSPKLAGLPSKYLIDQFNAFGDGTRRGGQSHQMKIYSTFYSEEDIKRISKHIESQEEYK